MTAQADVQAAVAARLAAAFPGYTDRSGEPEAPDAAHLPAFAVRVTAGAGARAGAGEALRDIDLEIEIGLMGEAVPGGPAEGAALDALAAARAAVLAAPEDLGRLVDFLEPVSATHVTGTGARRAWAATLTLRCTTEETP